MSFFSKLFGGKQDATSVSGVDDFSALIQVYFQATIATTLGINNPRFMPDVVKFKRTFKIATAKNKLGVAERTACKKMMMADYNMPDGFFKEIDQSIKKNCKTQNDIQSYLAMYQNFSNDLMMVTGNIMSWKMRLPSRFKKMMRQLTDQTVHDICTKSVWKDDGVHNMCRQVRHLQDRLKYSEAWMKEYVYHVVILAKKDAANNKNVEDDAK